MNPISVTLVGSSPWDRDLHAGDVNLRPALALAERLGGPYNVIVPAGGAGCGLTDLGPVRLYRAGGRNRPAFLRAARLVIDRGLPARADVLMSSDPLAAVSVELSRERRRTPHIFQVQGDVLDPGREYGSLLRRVTLGAVSRSAARRASAIRVVSQGLGDRARRWARGPVVYVPSRVDTRVFSPAPAGSPKPVHVVMVGSLCVRKNHAAVVRAWPAVVRAVPGARLVILGEGPARSELRALAAALGVERHVELRGQVTQDDIVSVLRQSRVLAHPSWSEGQPRAVLEAMACGLPVLCSDISSHREIVRPGYGRLLAPGSPHDWGEAIASLLTDQDRAHRMGLDARHHVCEHHDFEAMMDRFAEFVRDVTSGHPAKERVA
ncbi:glycosyltransferase [Sphaerisporangium flaviroseum]|uniref:Glycosyltransferase n=1 Tax=Sphaerisporangium flaviroseum TaxID=509199 RepID=A0ABP7HUQ8_9ACTN